MRILVTGARGFLGRRLLATLGDTHEVYAVSRDTIPPVSNLVWLKLDLAQPGWAAELPGRIDAVVHLAQSTNFRNFPSDAAEIYGVSAGATVRLLEWALKAGAKNFVLGSTGGLYGSSRRPVAESAPIPEQRNQLGFYFAANRAAELIARQYSGHLNVAILRFFFVYGSGQSVSMLMPRLVSRIREGKPIVLQGEEGIHINPIHVDDATNAILRATELNESRLINIAGPEVTSLRYICEEIGRRLNRSPAFDIDMIARPAHLVADVGRMTRALGAPRIGIRSGIAELVGVSEP